MTIIVNNPPSPPKQSGDGIGMIIGFIVLVSFAVLFFVYGLPAIKGMRAPTINIPSKIDVNINQQNK